MVHLLHLSSTVTKYLTMALLLVAINFEYCDTSFHPLKDQPWNSIRNRYDCSAFYSDCSLKFVIKKLKWIDSKKLSYCWFFCYMATSEFLKSKAIKNGFTYNVPLIFRDSLNSDNGVYTAQPFQRKAESSPPLSDEGWRC